MAEPVAREEVAFERDPAVAARRPQAAANQNTIVAHLEHVADSELGQMERLPEAREETRELLAAVAGSRLGELPDRVEVDLGIAELLDRGEALVGARTDRRVPAAHHLQVLG